MKKMITMLALVLTLGTTMAFAGETNVNEQVLTAFKQDFSSATDVKWTAAENYFKAEFNYNSQIISAYYTTEGDMMAVVRKITTLQLPINLQTSYKKDYKGFWVTDLFEVARDNGTTYYLTLETADARVILKSGNGSTWETYEKSRKS